MLKRGIFINCVFLVSIFSVDGFALSCQGVKIFSAESNAALIAEAPHESARYYSVGLQKYCAGNVETGINYIEKASDMGDISASYALGLYYRSDRGIDLSQIAPTNQKNYDAAIFYFDRTVELIDSDKGYPGGTKGDLPNLEGNNYMSLRAPLQLVVLYYTGYARALGAMLKDDVSYTDTIKVLENMRSAADRCLRRPSLSVWGARQGEIAHSKQIVCQARRDFAEKAIDLEFRRIEIAKHCDAALSECTEHQAIFNQIVQAVQEMNNKTSSVPKI